jgi:hypothetical protein
MARRLRGTAALDYLVTFPRFRGTAAAGRALAPAFVEGSPASRLSPADEHLFDSRRGLGRIDAVRPKQLLSEPPVWISVPLSRETRRATARHPCALDSRRQRLSGTASARRTAVLMRRTPAPRGEQTSDGSHGAVQPNMDSPVQGTRAAHQVRPDRTRTSPSAKLILSAEMEPQATSCQGRGYSGTTSAPREERNGLGLLYARARASAPAPQARRSLSPTASRASRRSR